MNGAAALERHLPGLLRTIPTSVSILEEILGGQTDSPEYSAPRIGKLVEEWLVRLEQCDVDRGQPRSETENDPALDLYHEIALEARRIATWAFEVAVTCATEDSAPWFELCALGLCSQSLLVAKIADSASGVERDIQLSVAP